MKRFLIAILCFVLCSCDKTDTKFNKQEKTLINSSNISQPMRVLLTTNTTDSLFLRLPCKDIDVKKESETVRHLIKRMQVTMQVDGGIGIAANQVGIGRNMFLITRFDKSNAPVEAVINPRIITASPDSVSFSGDGCLSIPNLYGNTWRASFVEVEYINEAGEIIREKIEGYNRPSNFTAIIFQHEFDHLQGILFTDRIYNHELYHIELPEE